MVRFLVPSGHCQAFVTPTGVAHYFADHLFKHSSFKSSVGIQLRSWCGSSHNCDGVEICAGDIVIGFKISSLTKMVDTKSGAAGTRFTLLNFTVQVIESRVRGLAARLGGGGGGVMKKYFSILLECSSYYACGHDCIVTGIMSMEVSVWSP